MYKSSVELNRKAAGYMLAAANASKRETAKADKIKVAKPKPLKFKVDKPKVDKPKPIKQPKEKKESKVSK